MSPTYARWDVFCRVIDNFGDIGVAWRLARDLACRGQHVRLWIDDATALGWMSPDGVPERIEVLPWDASTQADDPGDVVIETFGCILPDAFVERMAQRRPAPVWINLEYLSAEDYVERSHGLASPQFSGPGCGLGKRFYYPGFTARTGGLLREPDLIDALDSIRAPDWLAALGVTPRPGERIVSLFDYANPRLPELLAALGAQPTLLLLCPGPAQADMAALDVPATLRWQALPYLSQPHYDRLLRACDLNFVRGEDSFVRAQWAGKPFVWRIYPQVDGAHGPKLEAFLRRWLEQADPAMASEWRELWQRWNELKSSPIKRLPDLTDACKHAAQWRVQLAEEVDLVSQLLRFAAQTG